MIHILSLQNDHDEFERVFFYMCPLFSLFMCLFDIQMGYSVLEMVYFQLLCRKGEHFQQKAN